MLRRWIVFLACMLILFLISACNKNPKFNFVQGTRVGIINLLGPDATHTNFTSFDQDNFTKTYAVDWQMPSYAEHQLLTQLMKNTALSVVKIEVSDPSKAKALRLNMIERVLLSETSPPTIPPEGAGLLGSIAGSENVQVVVLIGSYSGPSPFKSAQTTITLKGYGLFTRSLFKGIFRGLLSFRKAYAFAQIGVIVFSVRPVTYLGSARASSQDQPPLPLNDFDWNTDINHLPASELAKAKPEIEQSIKGAVEKVLKITDLVSSGASLEDTGSGIGGAPAR